MKTGNQVRIAVAGLGFGRPFADIYRKHPDVAYVGVCERNPDLLAAAKSAGFDRLHNDVSEVIASPQYDAIHLALPVEYHVKPTLDVLAAGKHCACAVPMAFTIPELKAIVAAQRASGRNYMMMETIVYSASFLFIQDLYRQGRVGRLQFMRGCHNQDMGGWPGAWAGLPPMWYATHALGPLLALPQARATRVCCFGSGSMDESLTRPHGNPFPVETMTFEIEGCKAVGEVTRTLFETAPMGGESFEVYGSKASFSSRTGELVCMEDPVPGRRGAPLEASRPEIPMRWDLLPGELRESNTGHGGAYPHLVHEFIRSIVEARRPTIDAVTAADWCAVGLCAHESALQGGKVIEVPKFD